MSDKPQRDAESFATEYRRLYVKRFNMNSDAGVDEILAIHSDKAKSLTGGDLRNAVIAEMKDKHSESPLGGDVATRGEHTLTQQGSAEQDAQEHHDEEGHEEA